MRRFALLLLVVSLACGIHSTKADMEHWIGHDENEIISRMGAKNRSAILPNGSKVLTWATRYNDAEDGAPPVMLTCNRSFTFSPNGKAIDWSTSGCPKHYIGR